MGDKEVDDHEPIFPGLDSARFFDYVQDFSSEEMQKIWALKILTPVKWKARGRTSLGPHCIMDTGGAEGT